MSDELEKGNASKKFYDYMAKSLESLNETNKALLALINQLQLEIFEIKRDYKKKRWT